MLKSRSNSNIHKACVIFLISNHFYTEYIKPSVGFIWLLYSFYVLLRYDQGEFFEIEIIITFQSLRNNSYDHHAAIYFLLLERLKQHRSRTKDEKFKSRYVHAPIKSFHTYIYIYMHNAGDQ